MRIARALAGAGLMLTIMHPSQVHAQYVSQPLHFGSSAGLAIPLSDFSTFAQTGFYLSGFVEGQPGGVSIRPAGPSISLRGEFAFSGYSAKDFGRSYDIASFSGNVVLPLGSLGNSGPYLIGGPGLYHLSRSGIVAENDFGVNVGGGVRWQLAGMSSFVEIRYHYIASTGVSTQTLPITFGVVF